MPGFLDPSFDNERYNDINLSTSTSTSSTALLNSVRQQRQAREQRRKEDNAAILIQTRWRGFNQRKQTIERILLELENGQGGDWQATGRKLVLLAKAGSAVDLANRRRKLLVGWCEQGKAADPISRAPLFIASISKSEDWIYVLSILTSHILDAASTAPASAEGRSLLETLEVILDPKSWAHLHSGLASAAKAVLVGSLAQREWVEKLVTILEALIAASLPKKKHPSLNNVIQLLTAPLTLTPVKKSSSLLPPLLHTLLAVRALPTSLPIPALTHLSGKLPIFTILLPLAASNPDILSSGRLASEMGKTYFLANLATFGITGGLLARHGAEGIANWIKVIGGTINGIQEGWARWVDGEPDEDDDDEMVGVEDSDDEDDEDDKPRGSRTRVVVLSGPSVSQFAPPPRTTPKRLRRGPPLPPNIRSKLVLLTSSQHLSILAQHATRASTGASTNPLLDFAVFVSGLLNAFKGSPRWEAILEVLIDDGNKQNKQLVKTLWREGVRGRWRNSSDKTTWDTFAKNSNTPCLVFMTLLYNHYLLITPDDEFFDSNGKNPLTIDEVLDLAGIWRDLAFWSYMNGVEAAGAQGRGSEDQRNLLTRGVVRVAEKNARHKFADEDFWVMASHMNLQGFIEAAVFEDAELSSSAPAGEDPEDPSIQLPRWARHRQRFSKRQMAYISPRLGLLNNLPMAIPFQTRLSVFRQFIESDYTRMRSSHARQRKIRATIKRTSLAQDGFDQLGSLGAALKGRIDITFIDKFGQEEMGIDGGGLFKEFLTSLSKEVFDTNRGLWLATDQNELYPNPHSYATEDHQLQWYSFIGRVLGKALYEGILVDVSFANFFLAKWLGRQSYLDDLQSLDKDLYKGLIMLKNYPKPEDLSLNFTITQEEFGVTSSIDLVPGGSEIPVTAENRHEYIQLVCRYKLDRQIAAQSRAFFDGLSDIIDSKWLRMFDQQELRQLIGGEETLIDLDDLRAHVHVTGFPNDVTMKLFWRVVKRFTQEERRALLRFVTSCSRPPLLGFAYLYPQFGIRCAGGDQTRLPSASACANLLKLPSYQDEEALRSKLLQAITSAAGFDLS